MRRRIWLSEVDPLVQALEERGGTAAGRLAERLTIARDARIAYFGSGGMGRKTFDIVATPGYETSVLSETLARVRRSAAAALIARS